MPQPAFTKPAVSDQRSTEAKPSNMSQLGPRPKHSIISKSSSGQALPTGHVEGAETTIAPPLLVHPGRRDISYYTLCSTQLPCYKNSRLPGADGGSSGQPVLSAAHHRAHQCHHHMRWPEGRVTVCYQLGPCAVQAGLLLCHVTFLISGVSF